MADLWDYSRGWMSWLGQSSLQASVLIVLVLAVQGLLGRRLPGRWRYALWLLVLIRLALPTAPRAPWSVFNLPALSAAAPDVRLADGDAPARQGRTEGTPPPGAAEAALASPAAPEPPAAREPLPPPRAAAAPTYSAPSPAASPPRARPVPARPGREARPWTAPLLELLVLAWAGGAAVLLGRLVLTNARFHRRLRRHSSPARPEVIKLLEECRAAMGVRGHVTALETTAVEIPALFGLLRRRLLLPAGLADALGTEELRHVLRHELAHLKRRDVPVDYVATMLALLHWFNPLVWLALRRMRSDRELACDETVLARTRGRDARGYGRTMLKMLESLARPARLAGVVGVAEDTHQMQRRIRMIAQFGQKRRRWSAVGIVLLGGLGLVTLTNAQGGRSGGGKPAAARPKRGKTASTPKAPSGDKTDPDAVARAKLDKEIERLSFADIELKDVFQFLREYSDTNLHVRWRTLVAAGVDPATPVTVDVRKVTVRRALELVLRDVSTGIKDKHARLGYAIEDGVVVVSTRSDLSPERAWVGREVPARPGKKPQVDAALRKKLTREIPRLSFADIPLKDVLQFLREYSDANIHVNWRALVAAGGDPDTPVTVDVRKVTVRQALELILRYVSADIKNERDQPVYTVEDGVLTVSTRSEVAASGAGAGQRDSAPFVSDVWPRTARAPVVRPGSRVRLTALPKTKADAVTRLKLDAKADKLVLDDIPLKTALEGVGKYAGVTVQVVWGALEPLGIRPDTRVTLRARNLPAGKLIETILRHAHGAGSGKESPDVPVHAIDGGAVIVSTLSDLRRRAVAAWSTQWFEALTALPPGHSRSLSFLCDGRVAAVLVREGSVVKARQVLVRLDDAAQREELARLMADAKNTIHLQAADRKSEAARAELKRVQMLADRAAVSAADVAKAEAVVVAAQLEIELAKANLLAGRHRAREAEIRLEATRLTSPIDGRVERVLVSVGEAVRALTPVVRIVKAGNDPLRVQAHLPITWAMNCKPGQVVLVLFEGRGPAARGKVLRVSATVDAKTGRVPVELEVPNPTGRPAGEKVRVAFPSGPPARPAAPPEGP